MHIVSATSPGDRSSVATLDNAASFPTGGVITAWTSAVNLTYLNDDDPFTCETFTASDPVLLLLPFQLSSTLMLWVYTHNLRVESHDCSSPFLMATHNTQLPLGQDPCLPICGNPTRCQLQPNSDAGSLGYYTFMCPCNEASCRGIMLAIQPSAVIEQTRGFQICHVHEI